MILAIDPGVRALGWAYADARGLLYAGCSKIQIKATLSGRAAMHAYNIRCAVGTVQEVHLESMTWNGRQRTTPQDLIDVQTVGCLTAALLCPNVRLYTPQTWTSVPKGIGRARMLERLNETERKIALDAEAAAGQNGKEVIDAIRLYLFASGRADRAGSEPT